MLSPQLAPNGAPGYKAAVKLASGTFLVADLNASGELQFKGEYQYATLEQIPGAAELIGHISGALWRAPEEFEEQLDPEHPGLRLRWRALSSSTGIATVRFDDDLISLSLLCSGISEDADRVTLETLQSHLLRELRDTGFEPAFGLMELRERPLAATINFQSPTRPSDRHLSALADRCFAASYFRFLTLA
jgi:hypothetical protein